MLFLDCKNVVLDTKKRSDMIFRKAIGPQIFGEWKLFKAIINLGRLRFSKNSRTDKSFIVQPRINLRCFKAHKTELYTKLSYKVFEKKPSLFSPAFSVTLALIEDV